MPAEPHDLRRWLMAGAQAVKRARGRLDAINVFPVPDADTGTNMYLTLREGNRAVAKLPASASHREVVAAFARGALLGARGNSGVIISQYLSAFLTAIDAEGGLTDARPGGIARALDAAATAAYGAVGAPVEGTILSVAQAAARGADAAAGERADRAGVVVAAVIAARAALRETTDELPEARESRVVDAGAAGLVLQLEMLAETLGGPGCLDSLDDVAWELAPSTGGVAVVPVAHREAAHGGAYEVMFVVRERDAEGGRIDRLRDALAAIGDSVAVTATHGLVQAHVHTDDPDAAVAAGIGIEARQILVSALGMGHDDDHPAHAGAPHAASAHTDTGVVALTSCPGLAAPLADAGAVVLVVPDPLRLKRRELRRAVKDAAGDRVVMAAGNVPLRAAAERLAARKPRAGLTVLEAEHEAQVIAAVAAGAMATPGEDLVAVMRGAVARCRTASSSPDALDEDVDRLLGPDVEVVTLVLARGVPESTADAVKLSAAAVCPSADVTIYQGGHVSPGILVGVEGA